MCKHAVGLNGCLFSLCIVSGLGVYMYLFCLACKVCWSRWWAMSVWVTGEPCPILVHWLRHLSDTSLHLPTSCISGRLNKPQLIGRWWQTSQAQFIAVWRQPIHFPSVARVSPNVGALLLPTPEHTICCHCVTEHWNSPEGKKNEWTEYHAFF